MVLILLISGYEIIKCLFFFIQPLFRSQGRNPYFFGRFEDTKNVIPKLTDL